MDLLITSLGMISCAGRDVVNSCAAIRAGIVRPTSVENFSILDDQTQESTAILGYPIRAYTEGFNTTGLWMRLGLGCLRNLIDYAGLPPQSDKEFWKRTALIGV